MPHTIKLAELIGSLSYALDITEGQPAGHCVRCCWIGVHIGRAVGLTGRALWDLYYTLLLKDLGCSSNAARICQMYLTDDRSFKRSFKDVGDSLPQVLRFVLSNTGLNAERASRWKAIFQVLRHGGEMAQELIETRCRRGADIARQLRFGESVAAGIESLDEHWNGTGRPDRLMGIYIPLAARIALLSQVIDVFQHDGDPAAALKEVRLRAGTWFDPDLVRAFESVAESRMFWATLRSPDLDRAVLDLEPAHVHVVLDDAYLDDIAAAFGQVVDSKSPFTAGHSARVGHYTDRVASRLGVAAPRRRWLKRAALLHDVGKLGVSNTILDKPGKLDAGEWAAVRMHATFTEAILGRIAHFGELARVAASHHERLDGAGYPRGLAGDEIALETRIITAADIFDAITAERPYRGATPVPDALQIMARSLDGAIDRNCFEALKEVLVEDGELEAPARLHVAA